MVSEGVRDVDVLVVGAGLSGICAAYYLQELAGELPGQTFAVLEARETFGGTWDLFKYPGIRSDSDMYTLGFGFHPWRDASAIADASAIMAYLKETLEAYDLERHVRYGRRAVSASWSAEAARWTVVVRAAGGEEEVWTCRFLWGCTGYYSYEGGHSPTFEGQDDFEGLIVHPQQWPEDLDYSGKRVVVIGSGATAVTLVPAMAGDAAHVTMLQRSPSYVFSLPREDEAANRLRELLPERAAYAAARWKNILWSMLTYNLSRRFPEQMRAYIGRHVQEQLGEGVPVDPHFNPTYRPWDQRMCLVPDGDLFEAIKRGDAEVVTDHIERFVPGGVLLRSGRVLEADVIVTATGLRLELAGGMTLEVDGQPVIPSEHMMYRGAMLSGVPNLVMSLGYTNASWTLKCELVSQYFCRVIKHMSARDQRMFVPRHDPSMAERPLLDLDSGYIRRAQAFMPSQGEALPWRLYQNYLLDLALLRYSAVEDGVLELR